MVKKLEPLPGTERKNESDGPGATFDPGGLAGGARGDDRSLAGKAKDRRLALRANVFGSSR